MVLPRLSDSAARGIESARQADLSRLSKLERQCRWSCHQYVIMTLQRRLTGAQLTTTADGRAVTGAIVNSSVHLANAPKWPLVTILPNDEGGFTQRTDARRICRSSRSVTQPSPRLPISGSQGYPLGLGDLLMTPLADAATRPTPVGGDP